mmetsp:Transcript_106696/g.296971  ORF Transcript_106696/g.296971 Transcript_106696/m.296971 type:complete len:322 (+) Transcript_106696:137-1102(+)
MKRSMVDARVPPECSHLPGVTAACQAAAAPCSQRNSSSKLTCSGSCSSGGLAAKRSAAGAPKTRAKAELLSSISFSASPCRSTAACSGAARHQAAQSSTSSRPRRRSAAASVRSSGRKPRPPPSHSSSAARAPRRRPGSTTPACTRPCRSSASVRKPLRAGSKPSRCCRSSTSCLARRCVPSALITACWKSGRLLSLRSDCNTSRFRTNGFRASLSTVSSLRNGCSSACAAAGRWPDWTVSSDEMKAFARPPTVHTSAGTNAQSPVQIFFRSSGTFSASKGQWPLRRAKAMTPTAQRSQLGSMSTVRGLSDPETCSGAKQW